ncbi:hypothetical protein F4821DRAFT_7238 [Hypoxylon rubiginosum]|uniref:Uncharacterized protein n=1 Tax=Hypoxylon rubiginosum TaxID=110542 RepID=A0ACC0DM35_9PEZI|nr:hypothetical protein F4821DRAFT_7238 [Hypoxylon rubiginosum]
MVSFISHALVLLISFASVIYGFTYAGCYAPPTDLDYNGRFVFQSVGYCRGRCHTLNQNVLAVTNGTDCLCGSAVPPRYRLVVDSLCNSPCAGYAMQMCGGQGYLSVYTIADPDSPERPPNQTATRHVESVSTSIALPQASVDNKGSQILPPDNDELK